jgi:hypothetical protein
VAKPSRELIEKLKVNLPYMAGELDGMADEFDEAYTFSEEPPQKVVDVMFDVYVSGAIGERVRIAEKQSGCGPGPGDRCATCTGKCGK